ncbi:MAG TPA: DNA gyrase modulator, partial [Acidimicrobiales bacterium]|nr:DNA gyrase modulator [Acidimicrobiales bacterium]
MSQLDPDGIDPAVVASVSSAALEHAERLGCTNADVRIERIRSQGVRLRDARLETAADDTEVGVGVRVFHRGAVGFAATVEVTPESAIRLVDQAVDAARTTALAARGPVELAPEPAHGLVVWSSPYRVDPVSIPLADKVALFQDWSSRLLGSPGIDHVTASMMGVSETKHYADLS